MTFHSSERYDLLLRVVAAAAASRDGGGLQLHQEECRPSSRAGDHRSQYIDINIKDNDGRNGFQLAKFHDSTESLLRV